MVCGQRVVFVLDGVLCQGEFLRQINVDNCQVKITHVNGTQIPACLVKETGMSNKLVAKA